MMETKICKKCGRELPLSEFHKHKGMKDGYINECKECVKKYRKHYYHDNKEKLIEQTKQFYHDNKEKILERQKHYKQDNKEKILEYNKQYYQEKKEHITENHKQYYETPFGKANRLVNNYKCHDKEANRGECTLTAQWIIDNIFASKCHWCGETDWNKLGCDRIDNDKPHTPDNVNPCCEKCNKKRGKKTYKEFLETLKTPITYV